MSIESTLVEALLERLAPLKAQADVRELPGNADMGPRGFTHGKAAVWVAYNSSTYDKPSQTDGVTQDRTMFFDVQMLVRDLGGPAALKELVGAVRTRVHGFRCGWGEPVQLVQDGFKAHKDGVWRQQLVVSVRGPQVPTEDAPLELPTLAKITVEDQDGVLLFEVPPTEDP